MRFRKLMPSSATGRVSLSMTTASTLLTRKFTDAHGVQLDAVGAGDSVGGLHQRLPALRVVEPQADRVAGGKRYECRAGIHGELDWHAVNLAIGDKVAVLIDGQERARGGGRLHARMPQSERPALAFDFERRAVRFDRDQDDAFACLLSDRQGLQRPAVDLHDGLVREQADDVDVERKRRQSKPASRRRSKRCDCGDPWRGARISGIFWGAPA